MTLFVMAVSVNQSALVLGHGRFLLISLGHRWGCDASFAARQFMPCGTLKYGESSTLDQSFLCSTPFSIFDL